MTKCNSVDEHIKRMQDNLASIASELFRFQRVYDKAISKLDADERGKYVSQFAWFSKKVTKALEDSGLRILNIEGQLYDPGMAVIPLNIDDFENDDRLYVLQMIEPIVMQGTSIYKTGTVILGRVEE